MRVDAGCALARGEIGDECFESAGDGVEIGRDV